jgi:hypothetical protein
MNDQHRQAQIAAMNNEYNSLRGQACVAYVDPRKDDLALELTDGIKTVLESERDHKVRELRAQAERLEKMSAAEWVAEGFWNHEIQSFELLGRMAKVGWESVEYRNDKPGWRVHTSGRYEMYVNKSEVVKMLTDSGSGEP